MITLQTPNHKYRAKTQREAVEIFSYLLGSSCLDIKTKVKNKEYQKMKRERLLEVGEKYKHAIKRLGKT